MDTHPENKEFLAAYETFADGIFRHCYFRTSDRELARDLMQETFTKTWGYLVKGGEIKNFKAFLYRTAQNLIIDYYRQKKTQSLDALQEEGFEPTDEESNTSRYSEHREIVTAIQKIDREYRDALTMRYLEGLSPKEIAEILGEKENTISVRIHRGLKKVKEILGENQT